MSGSQQPLAFSTIYAFGDSLSDAGNVSLATTLLGEEPVSPPYASQTYGITSAAVFSNGPVWVQDLSNELGLGQLAPSLAGGNDFAYGGAEAGNEPQNSGNLTTQALSVPAQLSQFSVAVGRAQAGALFTLSIGGNDIFDILANTSLTSAQQATDVTDAVNNEISDISTMYGDGMRNIAVLNVPALGLTPEVTSGSATGTNMPSAAVDTLANNLAASYNTQLASGLATLAGKDAFNYHIVDTYSLIQNAVTDPSQYGYTTVNTPVWSGNFTSSNSGTLSSTNLTTQDQTLFFDKFHPTSSGHANIANVAYTEAAPSYIYEADLTTGALSFNAANPYAGQDTNLHTQFAAITPDSVALWASTPGTFLQTGTGDNVLVAQSGINVLSTAGGSNYLVSGSGTDSIYVAASATTPSWNAVANFHSGDVLNVVGYQQGVSQTLWTNDPGVNGAVLNINVAGSGTVWSSETFVGVSLSAAQHFATSVGSVNGLGVYTVSV
jgi:phospholipase/lecithinase/hemolysin